MEFTATAKYLHTSTRKLRLVADAVRNLSLDEATIQLERLPKRASLVLSKVVKSALNNASQKNVQVEKLRFKLIEVMGGPVMKRFHAASRGRAHPYKKRMTHVRVILTDDKITNLKSQ